MKRLLKYLIVIFVIVIVFFSIVYIDYFNAKTNNTYPRLSLKSEEDDAIVYTAVMYRVWYCKANKKYMLGSYNEDNICPRNYKYINGVYTNSNGIKISKKDLQMISNDGVYTSEMIESMNSNKQVEDAVYVANNYLKNMYKVVNETDDNTIIIFPEFKEVDGNYSWVYEEEEDNYYCLSEDQKSYSKYENEKCGKFETFKMDKRWCESYKSSTLIYNDEVSNLCKE